MFTLNRYGLTCLLGMLIFSGTGHAQTTPRMNFAGDLSCSGSLIVGSNAIRSQGGMAAISMYQQAVGLGFGEDEFDPEGEFVPRAILQIGDNKGMFFHDDYSSHKSISWNSYFVPDPTDSYARITNDSSACIRMNYDTDRLLIGMAEPGTAGGLVDFEQHGITLDQYGKVGIGTNAPGAMLEVNGVLRLSELTTAEPTINGCLYTKDGRIHAKDSAHNNTVISPHKDPREVVTNAQSSFSDPAVEIPFSFAHENDLIGKGAVVDMSKMVAYIEKKMQAELGAEAGRLVFVYDLPKEQCKTVDEAEIDQVMEELQKAPLVKVAIGADGSLPPEALEEVDEVIETPRTVTVMVNKIDFKTKHIIKVQRKRTVLDRVKTGKKTNQLKNGWKLSEEDGLFRQATLDDLDLDKIASKHPALPQWVLDRVKGGKQTKQSLSSLVEDIKKKMQASAAKSPDKQTLASNSNIK